MRAALGDRLVAGSGDNAHHQRVCFPLQGAGRAAEALRVGLTSLLWGKGKPASSTGALPIPFNEQKTRAVSSLPRNLHMWGEKGA